MAIKADIKNVADLTAPLGIKEIAKQASNGTGPANDALGHYVFDQLLGQLGHLKNVAENAVAKTQDHFSSQEEKNKRFLEDVKTTSRKLGQFVLQNQPSTKGQTAGSGNNSLHSILEEMELTLMGLEESYIKFNCDKQGNEVDIGKILVTSLKDAYDKMIKEVQQAEQKQQEAEKWSLVAKIASYIVIAVSVVAALATAGAGTAIVMAALGALSASGALSQITNSISASLQKDGLPKETADLIANIIVIVTVTVVSGGVAGTLDTATASSARTVLTEIDESELGTEMDELASSGGTKEGGGGFKFKGLRFNGKLAAMTSFQIAAQENLLGSLVMALPIKDKDKQKEAAQILGLIQDLVSVIASMGIGYSMSKSVSFAGRSFMQIVLKGYAFVLPQVMRVAYTLEMAGGLAESAGQAGSGGYTLSAADSKAAMASQLRAIALENSAISMNKKAMQSDAKEFQTNLKEFQEINSSFGTLTEGWGALANALQA